MDRVQAVVEELRQKGGDVDAYEKYLKTGSGIKSTLPMLAELGSGDRMADVLEGGFAVGEKLSSVYLHSHRFQGSGDNPWNGHPESGVENQRSLRTSQDFIVNSVRNESGVNHPAVENQVITIPNSSIWGRHHHQRSGSQTWLDRPDETLNAQAVFNTNCCSLR